MVQQGDPTDGGRGVRRMVAAARKRLGLTPRRAGKAAANRDTDNTSVSRGDVDAPLSSTDAAALVPFTVELRRLTWSADGDLEIEAWAFRPGRRDEHEGLVLIAASRGRSGASIKIPLDWSPSSEVDTRVKDATVTHVGARFTARLARDELVGGRAWVSPGERRFTLSLHEPSGVSHRFTTRYRWGSAGHPTTIDLGDEVMGRPEWDDDEGLVVTLARRSVIAEVASLSDGVVSLRIRVLGAFVPVALRVASRDGVSIETVLKTVPGSSEWHASIDTRTLVEQGQPAAALWYVVAVDDAGTTRNVHWIGTDRWADRAVPGVTGVWWQNGPRGVVRLQTSPRRAVISDARLDLSGGVAGEALLVVEGWSYGVDPSDLMLVGPRQEVAARIDVDGPAADQADGQRRFTNVYPLRVVGPWQAAPAPLRPGGYRITTVGGDPAATTQASAGGDLTERVPVGVVTGVERVRLEVDPQGRFYVDLAPGHRDSELGSYPQAQLRADYRSAVPRPRESVFIGCFTGQVASDNSLALFHRLQNLRPDLDYQWTVSSAAVVVPDGAESLLIHSREWWSAMQDSRYVLTNAWLSGDFRRQPHQRVLQAWHGTPLKRLGLDRFGARSNPAYRAKMVREVHQWDQLISQNPYSTEIFRRAYQFEGEILEIGYPRNDLLSAPNAAELRERYRSELGLTADQLVLLYCPTWREDSPALYSELDFERLTTALGPTARLLVRGHTNTIRRGRAVAGEQLIDVTLYPDLAPLFLVADIMITDYSSAMFDFSITGKPMVFFAPDLERYADELRGTYFPLAQQAPGPIVADTDSVVDAVRSACETQALSDRYRAWQRTYNPFDDGRSSQRAVEALLRPGPE